MAITRTAMIDDDGSGTTGTIINNAWKQELYNQIDAAGGAALSAWTPADASGAGLVLSVVAANYVKAGRIVTITLQMTFPATANGAAAQIGGLPFQAVATAGFYTVFGVQRVYYLPGGATAFQVFDATTGAALTNAQLSGQNIVIAGMYHAPT